MSKICYAVITGYNNILMTILFVLLVFDWTVLGIVNVLHLTPAMSVALHPCKPQNVSMLIIACTNLLNTVKILVQLQEGTKSITAMHALEDITDDAYE